VLREHVLEERRPGAEEPEDDERPVERKPLDLGVLP